MKRKNKLISPSIIFLIMTSIVLIGCEKMNDVTEVDKDAPFINTKEVTQIGQKSVVCGGIISSEGASKIVECGIIVSTQHEFDYYQNEGKFSSDSILLDFNCLAKNLLTNTEYHIKSFAKNSHGIGYGIPTKFTTLDGDYSIIYVSGNNQSYMGGMPDPMVFRVKNLSDNYFVNGILFEHDLVLEASAPRGNSDGSFSHYEWDSPTTYRGYWYVEPIAIWSNITNAWTYSEPPYELNILVSLRRISNNRLLDTFSINAYIKAE
jgi:hypothetical protein